MNCNVLVSVIIPVYNVQEYLHACLNSVLCQTYRNLEIILVDDGSTDASGHICDEYAERDKRITVIHQQNKGLSGARNTALDLLSGEYLIFIDSDDMITPDYVEYLLEGIVREKAQMCCCNFCKIDAQGKEIGRKQAYKELVVSGKQNCMKAYLSGVGVDTMAWAKIYHRSVFERLRYPEGRLYEDIALGYLLVNECEKIVVLEGYKYFYRRRSNSITSEMVQTKHFDSITAAQERCDFIKENYPELYPLLEKSIPEKLVRLFKRMADAGSCSADTVKTFAALSRKHSKEIRNYCHDRKLRISMAMVASIARISPKAGQRFLRASVFVRRMQKRIRRSLHPGQALQKRNLERKIQKTFGENEDFHTWDEAMQLEGRIAVYTCMYGSYDRIPEPAVKAEGVDYIAFTDAPLPEGSIWERREVTDCPQWAGFTAQERSRYPKLLPHRVLPEYTYSIYLDGNIELLGDPTPLLHCLGEIPIAFSWHPTRNCVYREAEACRLRKKADPQVLAEQMAAYREAGMPEHFGMTENNFIIRKHNDERCRLLMEVWWEEFLRFSRRDQLSLPYTIWKAGYTMRQFGFFPVTNRQNELLRIQPHTQGERK